VIEDRLYLAHMLEAIEYIEEDAGAGRDSFLSDRRLRQAVFHNLQIIGEAAKRVSQPTRELSPHIPWRQVAGLRDMLVHNYDGINPGRIWDIVDSDIPRLKTGISALLAVVEAQLARQASPDADGDV
jgi:uncharacterized protein with HEPN domain